MVAWRVSAEHEEFYEAVDWFRSRIPVADEDVDLLHPDERRRAFRIAGVTELDVVNTVHSELLRAIERGTPLEDFQKRVRDKLENWEVAPHQIETIFRTNVQTAYNAGRWTELMDPDITVVRPYMLYDAVLDSRTTEICRSLDGTVKAHDDPFVATRWPPLHHRCRSAWRSLRRSEAERRGITTGEPGHKPDDGFGLSPPLRGDGWTGPKREHYGEDLWAAFEDRQRELDRVSKENAAAEKRERQRTKKEDPQFWLDTEFRAKYGDDAGRAVAWGKAMEHRGRRLPVQEAERAFDKLVKAGVQMPDRAGENPIAAARRLLPEGTEVKNVDDLVEHFESQGKSPTLLMQLRSSSAMIGHHRSIAPQRVALPRGRVSGKGAPGEVARETARKHANVFYSNMADASVAHPTAKQYTVVWTGNRASHRPEIPGYSKGRIELAAQHRGADVIHEWGHAIDSLNPRQRQRALEFLEARTVGEAAERLRDLTGHEYSPSEVAKRDRFVHVYMGKIYTSGDTEITSMGCEYVGAGKAEQLYAKDPEMFWFILGQLAGIWSQ